ncbi:hypothetical protein F1559_004554 [Cyanidiococcus yangmingshanensis]|uniref:Uncharacterized protein n=1 Tax=Cyanidiococcus yangmingshanensis TaxID=2690220 RepID=A0A7J7IQF2_9RHOD|nr:hypothetical protein F1559_004554 [Cyanidiococcus yangmingshanensis]
MTLSRLAPTNMRRRRWHFPGRLRSRSVIFWVVLVSLTLFLSYGWILPRLNWKDNGAERERGEITTEKEATRRLGRLYRLALSLDDSRHCTFVVGVGPVARGRDLQRLISWHGFSWLFWNRRVYYLQGLDVAALRLVQTTKPRSLRSDVVFSRIESERAIDGVIGCAVSHLLALRSALLRGCETALFLEDDTSLGLMGLWDKPVADSIREYAAQEYPVLQMELKLRSFLERGHSGALGLEKLPVRCSARHTVPHQFKVTYGTGAYGMSRIGMKRTLQRFIADDAWHALSCHVPETSGRKQSHRSWRARRRLRDPELVNDEGIVAALFSRGSGFEESCSPEREHWELAPAAACRVGETCNQSESSLGEGMQRIHHGCHRMTR